MRIGIVILNYLNWQDTLECIESLRKQSSQEFEAVVVDNGSNNESVEKISDWISDDKNIHLIGSEKNLGFANGNNLGINFLKTKYFIHRILLVNNDVIFDQVDYVEKLSKLTYPSHVGAIGTQIIGSDGINQNPAYFPTSLQSTVKSLVINCLAFSKIFTFLKRRFFQSIADKANDFSGRGTSNGDYSLHGSVIFLTENYLNLMDGLFGGTFLYYEEVILSITFKKAGLTMLYYPEISIYHKEDQSSLQSFQNNDLVRRRFLVKSIISSLRVHFANKKTIGKVINLSISSEVRNAN
ncbi:glycosyltransferase family 2 protein [Streptococcus suis]|uniref:glycosyltransferase family 2 protein n=1 Tax=Streptococcus suis TaxID=1307 RepID=UPI001ABE8992|nr:glycosyltransferase [Streptococcus suis]